MNAQTIPQRELRNHVGEILRDAEAGTEFTITVRGRPVARLGPSASTSSATGRAEIGPRAVVRMA